MRNYGEALKYQREINGYSQSSLAKATGLKQQMISWWEAEKGLPNIDFCVQLANFYGITLEELLGLEDDFGAKVAPMGANSNDYTAEEQQLIEDFRKLNYYKQQLIKNNIKAMLPAEAESEQKKKV